MCPKLTATAMLLSTANHYGIEPSKLLSKFRDAPICEARQIVMYAIRDQLLWSYKDIAVFLNRKDHATVIHGCRKIEWMIGNDHQFKQQWPTLARKLLAARNNEVLHGVRHERNCEHWLVMPSLTQRITQKETN